MSASLVEDEGSLALRRAWAAMVAATTVDTWASILRGRPVMARQVEPLALRRAYRGNVPLFEYVTLDADALDAIAEAGPVTDDERRWVARAV